MSDAPSRAGKSSGGGAAVVVLLFALALLPVLYVLGIGPVVWHVRNGGDSAVWEIVYFPLIWLHEHFEPIRPPLDWYVRLWGG